MASRYAIDPENRIVRTTCSGVITHNDPIDHSRKLSEDPAFDPGFSELVEFEEVSEIKVKHGGPYGIAENRSIFRVFQTRICGWLAERNLRDRSQVRDSEKRDSLRQNIRDTGRSVVLADPPPIASLHWLKGPDFTAFGFPSFGLSLRMNRASLGATSASRPSS
jgi:hypothetical protein